MGISYNEVTRVFHLQAGNTSYVMQVYKDGYLSHLYWGRKIKKVNVQELLAGIARGSFSTNSDANDIVLTLDTLPQEYPAYGNTDFRTPAYSVQLENGTTITDLRYKSHRIIKGKPALKTLPATYVESDAEAETLEIVLTDSLLGLKAVLSYTAYNNYDVITRNVRFINEGNTNLKLLRALSMSVDFNNKDYDFMHLYGSWQKERSIERRPLLNGNQSIESRKGASGHQHNPFIALLSKNATEEQGEVYGFSLVYSGNFLAQAEVDQDETTRVSIGINPFDFSWILKQGESFQTPEAVMVYSSNGLGDMSRTYHKLYRTRLCRGEFRDKTRPVLVNNWEATYFDFNAEKIESIAKVGKELGIELFVLDDGWFGKRDNDDCSLGDWVVNTKKLPKGLDNLANRINELGLQFGLWFEPEMVSPNSDLYRAHPDWCLHVPNRTPSESRNQLILDLSREDVCTYIIKSVSNVLSSANISYVKWDMNRNMTEIGSECLPVERQKETAHRYMLGLYRIMDEITSSFPNILFESCSGGGGRFDPGMLFYMPQTWTSDNTDAVDRLKIQYGTSIVYPISTMGSHVSAVPNHQVHRNTSLKMRGDVAMSGNFGYELDLTKFSDEEKGEVKVQVAQYKELREIIQFGEMYRLLNPFEGNETAWMFVTEDKTQAVVAYFRVLALANAPIRRLKLKGLDPNKEYSVFGKDNTYGGDELMYVGLTITDLEGDYQSIIWILKSK
ncbi:alpha-galactosidase [Clostridium estertheticum]|uniref:alpha-galactosidase n=1 Tax=Clostridium estertheticum TaxID=238834 RepID=UPI001C0BCF25|nr:alpha-galactosidase [Clostridium estertheticum]MBU3215395.1 alpha-galactosidase [Clostridium estertheticum]WAG57021.1 alpha-galactosidase [Clostridium estertheticum]